MILGNKCDMAEKRTVSKDRGERVRLRYCFGVFVKQSVTSHALLNFPSPNIYFRTSIGTVVKKPISVNYVFVNQCVDFT